MLNFETILERAQRLTGAEREDYLKRACGEDRPLKERLEKLLDLSAKADQFFGEHGDSTARISTQDSPISEAPGTVIGRYKLREKVGEGGCGVVYVADQEEPVRRRVALKLIKLGMDTKSVIARFEAERQALAMMDHPNIAKVLDAGATDTGRPYFVMELVRGIKITDYCDQNNLTTAERLDLFIKVCQAVQHAHQKGIIHRDLKPSNILVTLHDGVPVPKVIDFGIAKATEGRLTDLTIYTELHQFIGTPAYMSPEQAEMSGLDIDTRSDIYSLGVLLYELLTGKAPFDAKELMALGLDAMRRTIRETEPVRPSTRLSQTLMAADARRLKPDADPQTEEQIRSYSRRVVRIKETISLVRGDLDCIVMKALEKDRKRRYDTANGLAADIQRHLNNEAVTARPPSASYRFQKALRRNKLAFSAATAVLLALILGLISTYNQATRARRAEALAKTRLGEVTAERDGKEHARKEAEDVSKFLEGVFKNADPERDGRTITVAESLDRAVAKLDIDLKDQPDRRAQLLGTLASTYDSLGLPRAALPIREQVRDYWRARVGGEASLSKATRLLANSYFDVGREAEGIKLAEEALSLSRAANGIEHVETIKAMGDLAIKYINMNRAQEALKLCEEGLELSRKILGAEDPVTISALRLLGISYATDGRYEDSLKLFEEVLVLSRKVNGPEHPDTVLALHNLALSYENGRRPADALKMLEEALTLNRRILGPEHPRIIFCMGSVARAFGDLGRNDEMVKLQEETLALSRKVNGPAHPTTMSVMSVLAGYYALAGHMERAVKITEEAFALSSSVNGPDHPETISAKVAVGVVLANFHGMQRKWTEAKSELRRTLEVKPDVADAHYLLALLEIHTGDLTSYERRSRDMSAHLDELVAKRLSLSLLLLPVAGERLKTASALADKAVALALSHYSHSDLVAKALAEYRMAHWAGALESTEKALRIAASVTETEDPELQYILANAHLVQAMAERQLNHSEKARAALAKGIEIIETKLPRLDSADLGIWWHSVILAHILLREAKALIEP